MEVSAATGTNLSNITNGTDEQFLYIYFTNASPPTVEHGTDADDISMADGSNWTPTQYDWLILWYDGDNSIWREVTKTGISSGSIDQDAIGAAAVGQGELKTSTTNFSIGGGITGNLGGGQYGFWPCGSGGGVSSVASLGSTIQAMYNFGGSGTHTGTTRYITASPPWHIDGDEWGEFIYVHRNISDGEILSYFMAPDPMWAWAGRIHPKDSVERRASGPPHPFYFGAPGEGSYTPPPGTEVVLIDLREIDLQVNTYSDNLQRGQFYRDQAAARAAAGAPLGDVLDLVDKAKSYEDIAGNGERVYRDKEFLLREFRAEILDKTKWDLVKDLNHLKSATRQSTKEGTGKPMKFGVKEIDDLVTIVTA
jgi:hypothetical protein